MTRALRLGAAALSLVALVACGDDDAPPGSASGTGSAPTDAASAPAASGDAVEIKATDKLVFDPATLTATVGTEFTGRIVQVGSVPHNIEFKDFDVKGEDTMVTKDGQSKEFSFTPDKAGSFEYVCTIHPSTMKGKLTVS